MFGDDLRLKNFVEFNPYLGLDMQQMLGSSCGYWRMGSCLTFVRFGFVLLPLNPICSTMGRGSA